MRQDAFRDFRADEHITDSALIALKVIYRATKHVTKLDALAWFQHASIARRLCGAADRGGGASTLCHPLCAPHAVANAISLGSS